MGEFGLVIDLSPRQLADPSAVERLLDTLREVGLPTHNVTFETTELALGGNPQAMETLFRLADAGCRFFV